LTARDIVNGYSQGEIGRILRNFGEERFAGIIAKKIADRRKIGAIRTTGELVEIIRIAIPEKYQHGSIHPATKTFQALRIETNKELEMLEKFVPQAIEALEKGGRLAIISFHSLEDRIVKNIFRKNARGCICPPDFPVCRCGEAAKVRIITKKPIVPQEVELGGNPRARSAKLRICEKL
jgi:16S rRNA (cytosine1402-N4)-methyltransferase